MENSFAVGDVVISLSGHDKNKIFLVVSIDKCQFLAIIDGKARKKVNPKRKNPKHLQFVAHDEELLKKFNSSTTTDTEMFNLLKKYRKE